MCLGIPGQIIEVVIGDDHEKTDEGDPLTRRGKVSFGGVIRDVSLAGVPEAVAGDWVIVHAGFALNRLEEDEAREVFDYLKQISEIADEEEIPS